MTGAGILVVRSGSRTVGLRLEDVVEVTDRLPWQPVPGCLPALRGVTMARGRLVPLVHLGALVAGESAPAVPPPSVVLADVQGTWVAFEVDEVDSAAADQILMPETAGESPALAESALRRESGWIPVLNLEALAKRWLDPVIRA